MHLAWARTALAVLLAVSACRDDTVAGNDDSAETGTTTDGEDEASGTGAETSGTDTGEPQDEVEIEELTPMQHLVRASMAIRGTRPSLSDLEEVEADPDRLATLVDGYLDSPRFGETIRAMHNEAFLVTPDYAYFPAGFPPIGSLAGMDLYALNRSVMEAPLRLAEHVVMNDLPYSEIVTADYTLADRVVATVWGLDYGGDGESWEVTAWSDGRENAGVLSDSWMFQRHQSTSSNANRGRANAIARALLCSDFLDTEVDVDVNIDLSDPNAVSQAVLENPSCAACHAQLDPLASYFRGFYPAYVPEVLCAEGEACAYPMELPWYEELFPEYLGVEQQPASYYGNDGDGLAFLGRQIAEDPRFTSCTVKRFYGYLLQVGLDDVPEEVEAELTTVFTDSGMNAKALVEAIVLSEAFGRSHVVPADPDAPTDAELAAAELGVLKARPVALGRMMKDLTGFEWVTVLDDIPDGQGGTVDLGRVPLLEDSFLGYRVLAGGIDSMYVTQPANTYTGPNFLVLSGLAREAAHHVVERDFDRPMNDRKLFALVEADETGEGALRDQLAQLHLRLYGERVGPNANPIDELTRLWASLYDISNDPERAWKGTLTAMLQDLRVAYY